MSLFTKVPKPTIVAPTTGADRSSANGEIRINQTFSSLTQYQDNFYNYLDKNGATFPSANNTGLEGNFIANQAIKSEHLNPIAGVGNFGSNTTLNTFNQTFVSNEIPITVPFANARVIWNITFQFSLNATSGTDATAMSEINVWLRRSSTSGFVATAGTTVFTKNNRAGQTNNRIDQDFSFQCMDTLTSSGTFFYRFVAQEAQNTIYNRVISGSRSTYSYIVVNGIA